MSALNENAITLLTSATVYLQAGDGKSIIYTVPAGKKMIPVHVVIREPTASLAGGSSFSLGTGANADTWKTMVNLSTLTAATDFMVVDGSNVRYAVCNAGDTFGILPVTGATADADATADLFGYLIDV